jgi:hypothetical protein
MKANTFVILYQYKIQCKTQMVNLILFLNQTHWSLSVSEPTGTWQWSASQGCRTLSLSPTLCARPQGYHRHSQPPRADLLTTAGHSPQSRTTVSPQAVMNPWPPQRSCPSLQQRPPRKDTPTASSQRERPPVPMGAKCLPRPL